MTTIRVAKDGDYSVIKNDPFRNATLSWEARGVLAYLLTKPDDWEVRVNDLIKQGPSGRDVMRRILRELTLAGHLHRIRLQRPNGTFEWISELYETPRPPSPEKPSTVQPSVAEPSTANPSIYKRLTPPSTESPSTESPSPARRGKNGHGGDDGAAVADGLDDDRLPFQVSAPPDPDRLESAQYLHSVGVTDHGVISRLSAHPVAALRARWAQVAVGGDPKFWPGRLVKSLRDKPPTATEGQPAPASQPPAPVVDDRQRPAWMDPADWAALTSVQREAYADARLADDGKIVAAFPDLQAQIDTRFRTTTARLLKVYYHERRAA